MTIGKMTFWIIAYALPLWLIVISSAVWMFGDDVDVVIDYGWLCATIFMGILAGAMVLTLLNMLAKTLEKSNDK